jgi:hypothetical protein
MKFLKRAFAMSILLGVFIAPITFFPLVNAQEGEVTLNPTDDTYTDSYNPDSNYGGQSTLKVSKYEYFDEISEEIVWLKFNLSDVPDGAVVDVATLQLYSGYVSETFNVYAHSCSDNSWTELTLTYANMPTFNTTSMDSTVVPTSFEWYNWTVIDVVRKGVDGIHGGPDVVTIVLLETSLRSMFSSVSLYSKEQELYVPKLTIHWSEIIPEFPTWTSMILILTLLTFAIAIYKRRLIKTPIH